MCLCVCRCVCRLGGLSVCIYVFMIPQHVQPSQAQARSEPAHVAPTDIAFNIEVMFDLDLRIWACVRQIARGGVIQSRRAHKPFCTQA